MPQVSKKRGFTLIEILVVISIIAILAGVVITSIAPARKKARDAQRVSDLANIRIALAIYKSQNGRYPTLTGTTVLGYAISFGPGKQSWDNLATTLKMSLPNDPINSLTPGSNGPWYGPDNNPAYRNYAYAYTVNAAGNKYELIAQVEDTRHPQRCGIKLWKRYVSEPTLRIWCSPEAGYTCPGGYQCSINQTKYLIADH